MSILPFLSRPFLFLTGPGVQIQERKNWSVRNKDQERGFGQERKTFLHDLRFEANRLRIHRLNSKGLYAGVRTVNI